MSMVLYSTTEAAEILKVSRQRVDQLIREEQLPFEKIGKHMFLSSGALKWWLEKNKPRRKKTPPEQQRKLPLE